MIGITGINYKTAAVEIRELFSLPPEQAKELLRLLLAEESIEETVLLSTCNRLEIYFCTSGTCLPAGTQRILDILCRFKGITQVPRPHFYSYQEHEAVEHLLRVTAGLDSMLLGENEILGQVKEAYRLASAEHTTGPILNKLFHKAFETGKKVRTETRINQGASSVGYAAVELAGQLYPELSACRIMLIGTGATGQLVLRSLKKRGCRNLLVTNRTHARAVAVAGEFGARVIPFSRKDTALTDCDIIIASAACSQPLISAEFLEKIARKRQNPLCCIDLSVPRIIDVTATRIPGISLFNIDDLETIVADNYQARRQEILKAGKIVRNFVEEYLIWYDTLQFTPFIHALKDKFTEINSRELENMKKKIPASEFRNLTGCLEQVNSKYLGMIIKNLKKISRDDQQATCVALLRTLFELPDPENSNPQHLTCPEVRTHV